MVSASGWKLRMLFSTGWKFASRRRIFGQSFRSLESEE